MKTPTLLEKLRDRFDLCRIEGDNVVIKCPACHHRGKTSDTSGHLRLNAEIMGGYCVRCGYKIMAGTLRAWLFKRNVVVGGVGPIEEETTGRHLPSKSIILRRPDTVPLVSKPNSVSYKSISDKGITDEYMELFDLGIVTSGKHKDWVCFPFYEDEKFVYYQARHPEGPKYNPVVDDDKGKSKWLYNMDRAKLDAHAIIVEGRLDCIGVQMEIDRCGMAETHFVVDIGGSTMSFPSAKYPGALESQFSKLTVLGPTRITVMLDADASSMLNKKSSAQMLMTEIQDFGAECDRCSLPKGDPNEWFRNHPNTLPDVLATRTSSSVYVRPRFQA